MKANARAILLGALTGLPTAAVQAADPATTDLPQVVVKGHKDIDPAGQISMTANAGLLGNRDQFETPFSQASYTDKLILDQVARTLDEVLDNNSSIRDTANSYSDAEQLNIRGFSSSPQSVLFNGVPGLLGARRPPLQGIARVDVLLGPSALLYNGVSDQNVGGVVNLQPKRAEAIPVTRVAANLVSPLSLEVHGDVGRRFGIDDMFGVRVNLSGMDGDTPIDKQHQRMRVGQVGLDAKTDQVIASVDLLANDYLLKANRPSLRPLAGAPIPAVPEASSNIFDKSSSFLEKNLLALSRVDVKVVPWLTVGGALGYARSTERYMGPYYARMTDTSGGVDVNVIPYATRNEMNVAQLTARATFQTGSIFHTVTLSGDYYNYRYGNSVVFGQKLSTNLYNPIALEPLITSNPAPNEDFSDGSRSNRGSLALADEISLLDDQLTVIAGLRQQSIDDRSLDRSTGAVTDEYKKSAVTPAVAAMLKLSRDVSVYANYIEALQSGPTAPGLVTNAGQVFAPFRARQYEAGAKWDLHGLGLTAAVFQISQPSAYTDSRTNEFVVNGETRNRGIELNAFGTLRPGLRVISGVSRFDPVQVRTGDPTTEGRLAIGIPHWQLNAGGEVDVAEGLTLTGRMMYTSREYVDAINSQSIPPWTRLDVGARYGFTLGGHASVVRFDVRNLANRNYWQDASQGLLYEGAPRTFRLSLTTDF